MTPEFALIEKYFTRTPSKVEGIGVFEIAEEAIRMHKAAFSADPVLANALEKAARDLRLAFEDSGTRMPAVALRNRKTVTEALATATEKLTKLAETLHGLGLAPAKRAQRVVDVLYQTGMVEIAHGLSGEIGCASRDPPAKTAPCYPRGYGGP